MITLRNRAGGQQSDANVGVVPIAVLTKLVRPYEERDTMIQDDFQPATNQQPAQTEPLRQTQMEKLGQQIPHGQTSASHSRQQPERVAPGRRPLFRS
jgi:hypothetical protein